MKKEEIQDPSLDAMHPDESTALLGQAETSKNHEDLIMEANPKNDKSKNGLMNSSNTDKELIIPPEGYDDQVDPNPSNYEKSFKIGELHYIYAIKNLCKTRKKAANRSFQLEDLPLLGKSEEVNHKVVELENEYQKYKQKHGKPSLLWPILKVFRARILTEQLHVILYCAVKILFALLLSKLLESIEQQNYDKMYYWAGSLFGVSIIGIYPHHFSYFQGYRLTAQLRPALIGIIYRKITKLSFFSVSQVSIGQIVNIAANDLNSIELYIFYVFYLFISPFVLAASLAVLWSLVGAACIPGLLCLFLIWPAQYILSKIGGSYLDQKNSVTDERIKLTNEMIHGIRVLKMYGWEKQYLDSITKTRDEEVKLLSKLGYTDYFGGHWTARLVPLLSSFIIFVTYYYMGGDLTASKVYSTAILLNFVKFSLALTSGGALKFIIELRLTFKRIIKVLEVKEPQSEQTHEPLEEKNAIEFENFSAFWGERSKDETGSRESTASALFEGLNYEKPTLKNLTFSVEKGTLCCLVGSVGSGKSTTLMSFLNEVPKTTGELRYSGRLAYVEQEIVIFPGTIRSNILFGNPYDEEKYNRIVEACCLLDDFKEFSNGDLTEIGERGVNLSGGQKARTSLARALYSDADIFLLDDPLSAVDTKVAKILFHKAIRGVLRNKTVLLATHQVHFAREAEKIIVLEDGTIKAQGTLDEIIKKDTSIMSIFKRAETRKPGESQNLNESQKLDQSQALGTESHTSDSKSQSGLWEDIQQEKEDEEEGVDELAASDMDPEKGKLITKETDESGNVGWGTYWYYMKNAGSFFLAFFLVVALSSVEVFYVLYTVFLGNWSDDIWTPKYSIKVLGWLLGGYIFALCVREKLFVDFGINVSSTLHRKLLDRVIKATIEFFDTNPAGRILNRFSNDVGVLDRFLLQVQNEVIDALFYFSAIFVTVCILLPWLILPAVVLVLFIGLLVRLLKGPIIQSRGLELVTRGPIYSLFSTTLSGLVSIQIYGEEDRFIREFSRLQNRNCRAFTFYYDAARVFAFYCDMASGVFACVGITLVMNYLKVSPAMVGLICSYLLVLTDHVQFAMRQCLLHLMQMASTARLKSYTDISQEAPLIQPTDNQLLQAPKWPSRGEVAFNDVYMRYRKTTDHVLKGLSFSVKAGEKIGCVGRTGAGKSSIIQALFRIIEIDREAVPNSSIMIDGVDISRVGLHTLRKNISIIPQSPFIFKGTVRTNLDPLGEHSEAAIIEALKETKLWDAVSVLPDGLDTEMSNDSSMFSVGQKQLICLARTLLQKNKILVLDEATANIDFETDNFIQRTIMTRFKDTTIFTIAHRMSTVANYDRVLVMDHGKATEFDHPYKLLVKNEGDKRITNTKGTFASMVLNTGSKHSNVILEIARRSYFSE